MQSGSSPLSFCSEESDNFKFTNEVFNIIFHPSLLNSNDENGSFRLIQNGAKVYFSESNKPRNEESNNDFFYFSPEILELATKNICSMLISLLLDDDHKVKETRIKFLEKCLLFNPSSIFTDVKKGHRLRAQPILKSIFVESDSEAFDEKKIDLLSSHLLNLSNNLLKKSSLSSGIQEQFDAITQVLTYIEKIVNLEYEISVGLEQQLFFQSATNSKSGFKKTSFTTNSFQADQVKESAMSPDALKIIIEEKNKLVRELVEIYLSRISLFLVFHSSTDSKIQNIIPVRFILEFLMYSRRTLFVSNMSVEKAALRDQVNKAIVRKLSNQDDVLKISFSELSLICKNSLKDSYNLLIPAHSRTEHSISLLQTDGITLPFSMLNLLLTFAFIRIDPATPHGPVYIANGKMLLNSRARTMLKTLSVEACSSIIIIEGSQLAQTLLGKREAVARNSGTDHFAFAKFHPLLKAKLKCFTTEPEEDVGGNKIFKTTLHASKKENKTIGRTEELIIQKYFNYSSNTTSGTDDFAWRCATDSVNKKLDSMSFLAPCLYAWTAASLYCSEYIETNSLVNVSMTLTGLQTFKTKRANATEKGIKRTSVSNEYEIASKKKQPILEGSESEKVFTSGSIKGTSDAPLLTLPPSTWSLAEPHLHGEKPVVLQPKKQDGEGILPLSPLHMQTFRPTAVKSRWEGQLVGESILSPEEAAKRKLSDSARVLLNGILGQEVPPALQTLKQQFRRLICCSVCGCVSLMTPLSYVIDLSQDNHLGEDVGVLGSKETALIENLQTTTAQLNKLSGEETESVHKKHADLLSSISALFTERGEKNFLHNFCNHLHRECSVIVFQLQEIEDTLNQQFTDDVAHSAQRLQEIVNKFADFVDYNIPLTRLINEDMLARVSSVSEGAYMNKDESKEAEEGLCTEFHGILRYPLRFRCCGSLQCPLCADLNRCSACGEQLSTFSVPTRTSHVNRPNDAFLSVLHPEDVSEFLQSNTGSILSSSQLFQQILEQLCSSASSEQLPKHLREIYEKVDTSSSKNIFIIVLAAFNFIVYFDTKLIIARLLRRWWAQNAPYSNCSRPIVSNIPPLILVALVDAEIALQTPFMKCDNNEFTTLSLSKLALACGFTEPSAIIDFAGTSAYEKRLFSMAQEVFNIMRVNGVSPERSRRGKMSNATPK